jgi:hypothetical protein
VLRAVLSVLGHNRPELSKKVLNFLVSLLLPACLQVLGMLQQACCKLVELRICFVGLSVHHQHVIALALLWQCVLSSCRCWVCCVPC